MDPEHQRRRHIGGVVGQAQPATTGQPVAYLDGPFSKMENRWTFKPTGETSCEVEFAIDYEFKSRTLGMLMGSMFDVAFRRFSAAFEARADQVYGRKTA